jgi:hypothetical protein
MGIRLRILAILSPVMLGLVCGLLYYAGMQALALALFGAYLLGAGALAAVSPERLRSFFLRGVNFDSWTPALQLFVSDEISLSAIRFSGALAMVMGALLLWAALFGPQ